MTSSTSTTTPTYRAWQKLPDNTFGQAVFSLAMSIRVPYFASVLPRVTTLEPGQCEVRAPKWWGVHNHLGTFHAIAACNLAEVAMGMLCEATVPSTHRWIPKSMNVEYVAKAETGLRAVATLSPVPDFDAISTGSELVVPITIVDRAGKEVVRAEITTWVTKK
ncbi:hotdog fold domain-containing protein [Rhodococcus sp. NPDC056743]|uniref:hotdog fold domain-containing protein n=1 Tax=Rhodococcus sp. NPDC056743 TaxID=3345934 RepID=UPI00366F90C3